MKEKHKKGVGSDRAGKGEEKRKCNKLRSIGDVIPFSSETLNAHKETLRQHYQSRLN